MTDRILKEAETIEDGDTEAVRRWKWEYRRVAGNAESSDRAKEKLMYSLVRKRSVALRLRVVLESLLKHHAKYCEGCDTCNVACDALAVAEQEL